MTNVDFLTLNILGLPLNSDLMGVSSIQIKQLSELGLIKNKYSKFSGKRFSITKKGGRVWNQIYKPNWQFAFDTEINPVLGSVCLYSVGTVELLKAIEIARQLVPRVFCNLKKVRHRFFFWSKSMPANVAIFKSSNLEFLDLFELSDALDLSQVSDRMWDLFLRKAENTSKL